MKKNKPKSISSYIQRLVITFTLLTTVLVTTTISFHEIYVFHKIRSNQREAYLEEQKRFIQELVSNEAEYIENQNKQYYLQIEKEFKQFVLEACNLADRIYERYSRTMSDAQLKELIITNISALEHLEQYSHVFINTLDGRGVYYKNQPDRKNIDLLDFKDVNGNSVVKREIELLDEQDEGFIHYSDDQSWGTGEKPSNKLTYVKKFGHFGWYIGYKGYLEDYLEDFKLEIAQKISSVRFKHGGYIFMNETGGDPVVFNGEVYQGNYNYYDGTDSEKRKVFELQLKAAGASPEGGYFSYEWEKIDGEKRIPKISYVRQIQPFNWLIGAGFYVDEINEVLVKQRNELNIALIGNLIQIFVILMIILALELWLIYRFRSRYADDFLNFRNFFRVGKGRYETINVDNLHYHEFKQMGIIANEMIVEREKVHLQLLKEQKRATESDRLKTAFLANMSHEIRTPMNAILGFSELMNDMSISPDVKAEFSTIILNNGEHLLGLINDIIDISKIESDQLTISKRKFSLYRMIESVEKHYNEIISNSKDKSIKLVVEQSLPMNYLCNSDEFRLRQVLDNLIGNAIKFTSRGAVSVEILKKGKRIYFTVSDTGIGIPVNEQKNIFKRFVQAKIKNGEKYGGTGLGLAISKNIIDLLGGDIKVKSKQGKGAVFKFHIPS